MTYDRLIISEPTDKRLQAYFRQRYRKPFGKLFDEHLEDMRTITKNGKNTRKKIRKMAPICVELLEDHYKELEALPADIRAVVIDIVTSVNPKNHGRFLKQRAEQYLRKMEQYSREA